jgi:hypothetical protein
LEKLIAQLPEQYKLVLTLYHLKEFSYQEIEVITGMPEGTVKSYLFRARKMLKDKLANLVYNLGKSACNYPAYGFFYFSSTQNKDKTAGPPGSEIKPSCWLHALVWPCYCLPLSDLVQPKYG